MGVKFWTSGGSPKKISKSHCYDDFFENGPQHAQNLKPKRKLFCTFYTNVVITQDTLFNISENKKIKGPKVDHFFSHKLIYKRNPFRKRTDTRFFRTSNLTQVKL